MIIPQVSVSSCYYALSQIRDEAPMRLRVCRHCKTKFHPSRADADFCRSLCRQAAYRMRKKGDEFEDAERRTQRIADAAALVAEVFEVLPVSRKNTHMQAEGHGIKDVKFMGTPRGVLAVEKSGANIKLSRKSLVEADKSARAVLMTSLLLLLLHEGTARRSGPSRCS